MENRKRYLFQRKAFYQTLKILKEHKSDMLLRAFFRQLKKISYYNAFYRVKHGMIDLGLIKIYVSDKEQTRIANTIRGARARRLLEELIAIEKRY